MNLSKKKLIKYLINDDKKKLKYFGLNYKLFLKCEPSILVSS